MLLGGKWGRFVQVSFEPEKVAHAAQCQQPLPTKHVPNQRHLRRHCVVEQDIHVPLVDFVDGATPFFDVTIMGIKKGEIERLVGLLVGSSLQFCLGTHRVGVGLPGLVDKGRAGNVDALRTCQQPQREATKSERRPTLTPIPRM